MTIHELKIKWLEYLIDRGRSVGTKKAYEDELNKFIKHLKITGINDVQLITTQIIEDYIFNSKVSINTKAWKIRPIKGFLKFLFRREYINKNPAVNLESIKTTQKRAEYLSQEQYTAFFKTVDKKSTPYYRDRDLMLVRLLVKTGLRRAEMVGLNVEDVDLSKLQFQVKRKGNRDEYLIIHNELINDLQDYIKAINRNGNEPLFMSKKGNRLSASSVWHLIKKYSHKAGLNGNVTVHSLRHTFATALLSDDMPLPYIQELMGHRSPQTTSRYLHVENHKLKERFNRVNFEERG